VTDATRDEAHWARPVSELHIGHELPADALNLNVEGHRLMSLVGGFGKMWQKTYRISLEGAEVTPQQIISIWKADFQTFWPPKNRFYKPMREITPGDVALINVRASGVKLSTGILVLYADDESFSFMCPEGHPFAGMITFSALEAQGATVAQVHLFIRAQDPLYELAMIFGGHRMEDWMWTTVLQNVAARFGVEAKATKKIVCLDPRRRWSEWRNVRNNAAVRSVLHGAAKPLRALKRKRVAV
jgi:hypothetical protein